MIEKGEKYNDFRNCKELAEIVRGYVKEKYKDFTFSITSEKHAWTESLQITLTSGKSNLMTDKAKEKGATLKNFGGDFRNLFENKYGYVLDNVYNMLVDIDNFVKQYHYVDMEILTDYYNTNFFYTISISYDYIDETQERPKLIDGNSFVKTYAEMYRRIDGKEMKVTNFLRNKEYQGIMQVKSATYCLHFKDENGKDKTYWGDKDNKFTRITANGFEKIDNENNVISRYEMV